MTTSFTDTSLIDQLKPNAITSYKTIQVIDRESTSHGTTITKTFNLNYRSIAQAVLKTQLLADKGLLLGFIPNEFKLESIVLNGHRFTPSDRQLSTNIVEKINNNALQSVLNLKGENTLSINFDAPIGAGVTSPNAEVSADLTIYGDEDPLAPLDILPNYTQVTKDVTQFIKDNTPVTIAILVLIVIAFIAVAIIISKIPKIPSLPKV